MSAVQYQQKWYSLTAEEVLRTVKRPAYSFPIHYKALTPGGNPTSEDPEHATQNTVESAELTA